MPANHFLVAKTWKIMIADMGVDPANVLRRAGLPIHLFSIPDAKLSPGEYFRLWHGLEKAAGDVELPLLIGTALSAEAFDPSIFASICSPDLNTALKRLARFKRLISPLLLSVEVGRERTDAVLRWHGCHENVPFCMGMSELVIFTQLGRLATRHEIRPVAVHAPLLPENPQPYRDYFGTRVQHGRSWALSFSARDAARPFLTEDAAMWQFFEDDLDRRLSVLDAEADTAMRVRGALLELLPTGHASLDAAARRLHMSKRSLQRYLSEENANFQDILERTRRDLAEHYLSNSLISPAEIALLLGYRDGNSFHRAFKSWTGSTPGVWRSTRGERATAAVPGRA